MSKGRGARGRGGAAEPTWAHRAALAQGDILVLALNLGAQDASAVVVAGGLFATDFTRHACAAGAVVWVKGLAIGVCPPIELALPSGGRFLSILVVVVVVIIILCKYKRERCIGGWVKHRLMTDNLSF